MATGILTIIEGIIAGLLAHFFTRSNRRMVAARQLSLWRCSSARLHACSRPASSPMLPTPNGLPKALSSGNSGDGKRRCYPSNRRSAAWASMLGAWCCIRDNVLMDLPLPFSYHPDFLAHGADRTVVPWCVNLPILRDFRIRAGITRFRDCLGLHRRDRRTGSRVLTCGAKSRAASAKLVYWFYWLTSLLLALLTGSFPSAHPSIILHNRRRAIRVCAGNGPSNALNGGQCRLHSSRPLVQIICEPAYAKGFPVFQTAMLRQRARGGSSRTRRQIGEVIATA